jgi:hypothetical protein
MKIHFNYMAQLAVVTAKKYESLTIDNRYSLLKILHICSKQYGDDFRQLVFSDEMEIHPSLFVAIDGAQLERDENPYLEEGQTILLMPPIAGG